MLAYALLQLQLLKTKFFGEENGAVDLVVIVILIAIVVVLGIAFRDKISEFLSNIFGDASDQAGSLNEQVTFR